MNSYIEKVEALPFSLWDGLQISIPQVVFLFIFIAGLSDWMLEKTKTGLKIGLVALLGFFILRDFSFWQKNKQQKIIVYNVPQHQAIDFINGRHFFFAGDPDLLENDFARNFHLKPSRISQRIGPLDSLNNFISNNKYVSFGNKNILLLDSTVSFTQSSSRQTIDLLVLSKKPKLYISRLNNSFIIKHVVFDGSGPAWRLKYWKKDCDSLHIPYYVLPKKGLL